MQQKTEKKFDELLEKLNINRPKGIAVWSTEEGIKHASEIGYPVLVRPSYVLGGQGMEITYNEAKLKLTLIVRLKGIVKTQYL